MKLGEIFRDGMVLQHGKPIRIYGEGQGEILAAFGGMTRTVQANGAWCVEFPARPIGGPYYLYVKSGSEELHVYDIMIGEVILCGGQSNMEFTMAGEITPPKDYVSDPLLRIFVSSWSERTSGICTGDGWVKCDRKTVDGWSAIAYHLGLEIRKKHRCAVGMVVCSLGATNIQTWMHESCWYDSEVELPPESMQRNYKKPGEERNVPGALYHDMLTRLMPYSFAGAVFYQGESNSSSAEAPIYDKLLALMVKNWRESLRDETLPFTIVQIADYIHRDDERWRQIQASQLRATEWIPGLSTVKCADICENDDIHPKTKWKLAHRIYEDMMARGILSPALTLRPGEIFRDGMVLQQGKPIRVFGECDGEVSVTFLGETRTCTSEGKWLFEFPPKPCGGPYEMTISGCGQTITIRDIMIGEVILFSGQSNIQFRMNAEVTPPEQYVSDDLLRIFVSERPEPSEPLTPADGWVKASPDVIGSWSAVAYLTGLNVRRTLGCAVGVIACSQGASAIQSWIDERLLVDEYEPIRLHANPMPNYTWNAPGLCYHFMLERLLPYAVSSVVWYQGESNSRTNAAPHYGKLLELMIGNWRRAFFDETLPFCIVQLANYIHGHKEGWAMVQQAQLDAPKHIENAFTVICSDICEDNDIHPPTKYKLAERIANTIMEEKS